MHLVEGVWEKEGHCGKTWLPLMGKLARDNANNFVTWMKNFATNVSQTTQLPSKGASQAYMAKENAYAKTKTHNMAHSIAWLNTYWT